MTAIRKHLVDVVAILGLMVIAFAVASVILANQRLALPGTPNVRFIRSDKAALDLFNGASASAASAASAAPTVPTAP